MKVLKPGRKQKGWAAETECTGSGNGNGGCGAVLLVDASDLFRTWRHSYGETSPDYYATFACPSCGVLTDVKGYPGHASSLPRRKP
ncbi:MAG TPA: hypothetical protein VGK73_32635 [Polyangiaceae bacterium]